MRSFKLGIATMTLLVGTALSTPALADDIGSNSCRDTSWNTTTNEGGLGVGHSESTATARAVNQNANTARGGNATSNNANVNENNAHGGQARASNRNEIDNQNNNTLTNRSSNENLNTQNLDNVNLNVQGQSLNNRTHNEDTNTNTNTNNNQDTVTNTNHNNNSDVNTNANKQGQDQGQDQEQSVQNVGNVHIENERPPVSTAYAAPLVSGEDTCMGSSSIGAQAVTFGLSVGTTWQDDNCRRLKNSRQLVALGYHRAATALMCVDEDVRSAMIAAGTPCPNGEVAAAPAPTRTYVMMAPVPDKPAKGKKHRKQRKPLPPK